MQCPKCGETNKVYFEGAFFMCYSCDNLEWVKDYENKDYEKLRKRWKVIELKGEKND